MIEIYVGTIKISVKCIDKDTYIQFAFLFAEVAEIVMCQCRLDGDFDMLGHTVSL